LTVQIITVTELHQICAYGLWPWLRPPLVAL